MERFDMMLEKDIKGYKGEQSEIISHAPAFYRLMTRLLGDPALPRKLWQLVIAAIAYFILPSDIIPESIHGPHGYVDDLFLCAIVADRIRQETGSDSILINNWDGTRPIMPLIDEMLARERELVGGQKDLLLDYIGYDQLE